MFVFPSRKERRSAFVLVLFAAAVGYGCSGLSSPISNPVPERHAAVAGISVTYPVNPSGSVLGIPPAGGFGGTIAIGSNTASTGTTITITSSVTPPPGPFNPAGRRSGNPEELFYVQFSFSQFLVVTGGVPAFTITVPSERSRTASGHFFLAIFDVAPPFPQQLGTLGPATVSGNTLTFASPTTPFVASTTDTFLATLYEDDTTPKVIRQIKLTNPSQQQVPQDLALGGDENIWVTISGGARIDRINPEGGITHVPLPAGTIPGEITRGPDNNMWLAGSNAILRVTMNGAVTKFQLPTPNTTIGDITRGPEESLWFTEFEAGKIGSISSDGEITEFVLPGETFGPTGIAKGDGGRLWYALFNQLKIGNITTDGFTSEFPILGTTGDRPTLITEGGDGNIWFADGSRIGRVTRQGVITLYIVRGTVWEGGPSLVTDLVAGKDGNVWFADIVNDAIGRITPSGIVSEYPIAVFGASPDRIAIGPDRTVWFAELNGMVGVLTYQH